VCDANGESLQPLLARPPAGLRGLTVSGLCLQQSFVEQLVGLTGLTSLQLVGTCIAACLVGVGRTRIQSIAELELCAAAGSSDKPGVTAAVSCMCRSLVGVDVVYAGLMVSVQQGSQNCSQQMQQQQHAVGPGQCRSAPGRPGRFTWC
jgi:hypothetical protein